MSAKHAAFTALKPVCSVLLELRQDSRALAAKLKELQQIVDSLEAQGLEACKGYVLFPLLMIVDSAVLVRGDSKQGVGVPAARSDDVAESAVQCIRALVERTQAQGDEVVPLLERLCPVLTLPRESATEEVRLATMCCISATVCSRSCSRLAEADGAPLAGFLAHLLLTAADQEIKAGGEGSKSVRCKALQTLGQLIEALGGAGVAGKDTLAYLLPGLVGGLGRELLVTGHSQSGHVRTGASGSAQATAWALRALVRLVCDVLGDDQSMPQASGVNGTGALTAAAAVAALERMQVGASEGEATPAPLVQRSKGDNKPPERNGGPPKVSVARTAAWRAAAAEKLQERLAQLLPVLEGHPSPSVRQALAEGVVSLLQDCGAALAPSVRLLLRILFTLAQDGWPQVARPCMAYLRSANPASTSGREGSGLAGVSHASLADLTMELVAGLPGSLEEGEQQGIGHARRLVTALQACGSSFVKRMVRDPGKLSLTCSALLGCFAYDSSGASLLLYATSRGGSYTALPAQQEGQEVQTPTQGAALQPRMPLGLSLISGQAAYEASAAVCRTLGRLGAQDGASGILGLLDHLTDLLHDLPRSESGTLAHRSLRQSWQCTAASVVTILTEAVYGASSAWQPTSWLDSGSQQGLRVELRQSVVSLLEDIVWAPLWGVPSHNTASAEEDGVALTPQALGENVILIRSLLDAVGCCARVLGPPFASEGTPLRVVLLPLLERLGDPCPSVATTADDAITSICLHCNYPGLQELVADNLDYIVDGLCAQLRDIESHPRAPFLFAVLLRKSGVAPDLLPLLAEPARASVRSLGILARRKRPRHVNAFLAALQEIVGGAGVEAGLVLEEMQEAANRITEAVQQLALEREAVQAQGVWDAEHEQQVVWTPEQWAAADRLWQRMHAVATIMAAAVEVATPLLTSMNLQMVLLALEVGGGGLEGLASISAALDLKENSIDLHLSSKGKVEPVAPQVSRALPFVHQLWGPLMAAIKDSRIVVVEQCLQTLVRLAEVGGGDFLRRRMRLEAWPILSSLLARGVAPPAGSPGGGSNARALLGGETSQAPAVLSRARLAVLAALDSVARSKRARSSLKAFTSEIGVAAVPFLEGSESRSVKLAARKMMVGLAEVDSDAIWLILTRLSHGVQAPPPNPDLFASWAEVHPAAASSLPGSGPGSAAVAAALLEKIREMPPSWEARLEADARRREPG